MLTSPSFNTNQFLYVYDVLDSLINPFVEINISKTLALHNDRNNEIVALHYTNF